VGDELVAEEIKIHPLGRAAALRAVEQRPVERACGGQVVDRDREMERLKRHGSTV
jgi:hypothetical protein